MHWSRWGDPAQAGPLSESAFALVDAFIGTSETPAVDPAERPALRAAGPAAARRARAASSAPSTCSPTTRPGCTAPAASPPPTCSSSVPVTARDSPDAVVRPGTHDEVAALIALVRVERHVALVPFGGGTSVVGGLVARREGFAGVVSLDLRPLRQAARRRHRLDDRDPRARPARPAGRGAAGRARPDAGPLPAVLRVRLHRRLRGHPLLAASPRRATGASTRSSSALRVATPQGELVLGNSPANAAGPDLREVVMGSEGAFGVVTAVTVRVRHVPWSRSTRAGAGTPSSPAPPRCARSRRPACCRRCCGSPTRPRRGQPGQAGRGRRASRRRLPDGHRLRGHPGGGRRQARCRDRAARRARWHLARRGAAAGPRAGSTVPTCATRCSTWACSSRPSRR